MRVIKKILSMPYEYKILIAGTVVAIIINITAR